MLVEDNPNFEKIVFEIETNGQVAPIDAFKNAVVVAQTQLNIFGERCSGFESRFWKRRGSWI